MKNFIFLTIFPEYFKNYFSCSIAKIALKKKLFDYKIYNPREFANKGKIDDYPYGGGSGMVLKIEPLARTLAVIEEENKNSYVVLLSPQGKRFNQKDVSRLLKKNNNLVFVCGHYEGFDQRIYNYVDEEISIGDFVVTGGELPSLLIVDSLIRGIPNVIKKESFENETFSNEKKNKDFSTYTRPSIFNSEAVPEVLLSGNHKLIQKWRNEDMNKKAKTRKSNKISRKKIVLNPNKWRIDKIKK